jgi:hypothetical protein
MPTHLHTYITKSRTTQYALGHTFNIPPQTRSSLRQGVAVHRPLSSPPPSSNSYDSNNCVNTQTNIDERRGINSVDSAVERCLKTPSSHSPSIAARTYPQHNLADHEPRTTPPTLSAEYNALNHRLWKPSLRAGYLTSGSVSAKHHPLPSSSCSFGYLQKKRDSSS